MADIDLDDLDGILMCDKHTVRFGGKYCRVCYLEAEVTMLREKVANIQKEYDDLLDVEHGRY